MHMIQAQILHHIIEYVQDKIGKEPFVVGLHEDVNGFVVIDLRFIIGRDYPGMKPEEGGDP